MVSGWAGDYCFMGQQVRNAVGKSREHDFQTTRGSCNVWLQYMSPGREGVLKFEDCKVVLLLRRACNEFCRDTHASFCHSNDGRSLT